MIEEQLARLYRERSGTRQLRVDVLRRARVLKAQPEPQIRTEAKDLLDWLDVIDANLEDLEADIQLYLAEQALVDS